jgi:16S rRNA (cytosine967-C5)-methyltransferase
MPTPDSSPRAASGSQRSHRQLEIFGELLHSLAPAARREENFPTFLQHRLGRDRRFGSRDRRLYRALAYSAVRHLAWIEAAPAPARPLIALWLGADEPSLASLRSELLADWPALPATPAEQASLLNSRLGIALSVDQLFPAWLAAEAPSLAGDARDRLLTRSPLWLRLQTADPQPVLAWLAAEGIPFRRHPLLPDALALLIETDLTRSALHEAGAFEIQDIGSQLILALACPQPGSRWLDACAGAGGKTLQLGRLIGPAGNVEATDIRPAALAELRTRATRAGLANVTVLAAAPAHNRRYDAVLVDAPCSGSGTWRRSPHLRWQTTAADLLRQHQRQLAILSANATLVSPGGRLIYATCSLARTENEGTVAAFLAAHPHFHVVAPSDALGCTVNEYGTAILPAAHDGDAFFVSLLECQP